VNIVIPMAGRGSRFADVGFDLPKPLIPVHGRPLYAWATECMPLDLATRLVFVCLREHLDHHPLAEDIRTRFGDLDPVIVALDGVTDGQLCTVLETRDHLVDGGLAIYNADTYCRAHLGETLAADPDLDGVIGVFEADGDHWSFARLDDTGIVVETAEKRRISPWATTGLYHFADVAQFLAAADAMIAADERTRGEFYVAPLYNRLIADGARIGVDVADQVIALGTPEELEQNASALPDLAGGGR